MQLSEIIDSQPIPSGTSSQKAELTALTRALTLIANRANMYTDPKYTFHIIHSHAAIWKERGLLSTKDSPITNALIILQLFFKILYLLVVPGLSCGMQTLTCSMWDLVP